MANHYAPWDNTGAQACIHLYQNESMWMCLYIWGLKASKPLRRDTTVVAGVMQKKKPEV